MFPHRLRLGLLAISLAVLFAGNPLMAWPRMLFTDAQIVPRADLIAIGHIKAGSIKITMRRGSYESRAVLVVTSLLKGSAASQEIPILIHYGLVAVPEVDKDKIDTQFDHDMPFIYDFSKPILFYEDNPSEGFSKISNDIRQDHTWLLRQYRTKGEKTDQLDTYSTDILGVWDPEDVQPLTKTSELQKYLP